jgi:hypothetical protein
MERDQKLKSLSWPIMSFNLTREILRKRLTDRFAVRFRNSGRLMLQILFKERMRLSRVFVRISTKDTLRSLAFFFQSLEVCKNLMRMIHEFVAKFTC